VIDGRRITVGPVWEKVPSAATAYADGESLNENEIKVCDFVR
jgi:hypothetical protein